MSNRPMLQHRVPLLVTASLAVLGLAASPAFAGSDGDQPPPAIEQPPAPPAPTPLPLPQPRPENAPAPAPADSAPVPSRSVKGERTEKTKSTPAKTVERPVVLARRTTTTRAARAVTAGTFPTGGVQAGAGGTSLEPATPAAAIGLGGAALVLLLASGGVAAARRR
jgi:outer membrane biosynthesis protein TonB